MRPENRQEPTAVGTRTGETGRRSLLTGYWPAIESLHRSLADREPRTDFTQPAPSNQLVKVDADRFGHPRYLTTPGKSGFLDQPFDNNPRAHARLLLQNPGMRSALALDGIELRDGNLATIPRLGYRVEFRQVATVKGSKRAIPVNAGFIHVHMGFDGCIYAVESTLRRGAKPKNLNGLMSREQAVKQAKAAHGAAVSKTQARATLTLSLHKGRLNPVYRILLSSNEPKKIWQYLVSAQDGKVLHGENRLHHQRGTTSGPVRVRCLLAVPDATKPIDTQVRDHVLSGLKDPKVLETEFFSARILKGGKWQTVKAKADGTFNYSSNEPEFLDVCTIVAMSFQMELNLECGLVRPDRPIPVFCDDPDVEDNAYFDPENYEIHLGRGAQVLTRYICLDLGVGEHELGHNIVFIQCPAQDLPGREGAAMHESTGDIEAIVVDFLMRLKFGQTLGRELTKEDILNSQLIIGEYALYPNGIRKQKNKKQAGRDQTGEPHDDGEISGGACADLLLSMVKLEKYTIEQALRTFLQMYLGALALMPAHKCMFRDLLRCMLTSDQRQFNGEHQDLIISSFAGHNIKLSRERQRPPGSLPKTAPKRSPRRT